MVNPNFRAECNSALINQFASWLHDDIMQSLARELISRKPRIWFIQFQAEIANLSQSHLRKTKTKVTASGVEDNVEDQCPSQKAKLEESTSVDHIRALIESNRHLASQIETLTNITTHQVQSFAKQVSAQPVPQNTNPRKPVLGKGPEPRPKRPLPDEKPYVQNIVGGVSVCQGCPTPIFTQPAPNNLVFRMVAIRP